MTINAAAIRLVFRALRYRYRLNRLEIGRMMQLIGPGGVCIDIGAHKGAYSYWMARRTGRAGQVLAFEPQQRLVDPLEQTFASMHWKQVQVIGMAVSNQTATNVPMSVRRTSTHGAALDQFTGPDVDTVPVQTTTIDDYLTSHPVARLDFIKIDAEGHELSILNGAVKTLAKFRPAVLAEIESRHHERAAGKGGAGDPMEDVLNLLSPMGYSCEFPFNGEWRPVEDFDAATHQTYGRGEYVNNFLFTARG